MDLNKVEKLPPFKNFFATVGNIPSSYQESMTYYEMLQWFCDYLENTVIPTLNNNGQSVIELQNLFIQLHDYVEKYFNDLDVQQEINNKLDTMASDGTLDQLLLPYFNTYKNEINNIVNNQNSRISSINTKVNSATNGSPLVASSISDMTNTDKIYVNTSDGNWYYYNGSNWVSGGKYQSTGISDNSITNKYLSQYITGVSFNCVVPSDNKNLVVFDILPSKRFYSNEHTIKIKGKYILKSKSFTWSYVSLAVNDPGYYSEQKKMFSIDVNTPRNKEIDFESTITPFSIHNIVKQLKLVYDNSFSNQTSEIEFVDIMIYIDDELYSIGDILLPALPSYTTTITNPKNYLADKIMLNNFYNKNKEYSDNNLQIAKNYTDSQINNLNNFDSSTKSNLHSITCFGDSITEGGANDGKSYPSLLKDYINNENVSVRNCGQSGQLSGAIAIRQGGIKAIVSENFTIPSTTDEIEIPLKFSSSPTNKNGSASGTLNGVEGKLIFGNPSKFKRTTPGASVNVPAGTEFISNQSFYNSDLQIFWVARNDMAFSWPNQITGPINAIKSMVNYLSPTIKRFLVISCTTTTNEKQGDESFGWITSLNNQLKTLYPNNFVDIQNYLVTQAIYDAGITPTADDLEHMQNGTVPPSLMFDFVHPNIQGRKVIAKYIYNTLCSKSWAL